MCFHLSSPHRLEYRNMFKQIMREIKKKKPGSEVSYSMRSPLIFFLFISFYFMYEGVLSVGTFVYHEHSWYLGRSEEGIVSPETGVTDCCVLPCGCWEWGPLQDQPLLITAEPFLQPPSHHHCYSRTPQRKLSGARLRGVQLVGTRATRRCFPLSEQPLVVEKRKRLTCSLLPFTWPLEAQVGSSWPGGLISILHA